MLKILYKIVKTPNNLFDAKPDEAALLVQATGQKISHQVKKLFHGSLAIRVASAGSTNACEQELVALGNSFYDIERFGIHFVASPRHADLLLVTGPVTRNMAAALKKTYEAMPEPKIVVALGADAIDGGLFHGSYAVLDGAGAVVPVNYQIPGDPPTPLTIINALLFILNDLAAVKNDKK